jgi:AMP-binding enzyme/Acetyl-coenzyme A synthetase N-terminus
MTYTWHPSRDYLENSNVSRLMRTLGTASAADLRARSVADIGAFWDAVVRDLGIGFRVPYRAVVDLSGGIAYPDWFPGGQLNVVDATLDRWARQTPGAAGWIMGPLSIIGTHANGGTVLLYEGSPDAPDAGRLWHLTERHRVSMLGVSPTLIRSVRAAARGLPDADLSAVRVIGSTGEPWDPESYEWLARDVFGGRVPVINFSGGTEVGGSFLCPYPVEDIRSCSLGGPALGMDVDVVDDDGQPLRGRIGELVCRQPWPGMTRGIWRDDERYREAYWSRFPGMWRHGDYALAGLQ